MSGIRLPSVKTESPAAYEILSPHGDRAFVGSCTRAVFSWLSWRPTRVDHLCESVGQWNGYLPHRVRSSLAELHMLRFVTFSWVNGEEVVYTVGSPYPNAEPETMERPKR